MHRQRRAGLPSPGKQGLGRHRPQHGVGHRRPASDRLCRTRTPSRPFTAGSSPTTSPPPQTCSAFAIRRYPPVAMKYGVWVSGRGWRSDHSLFNLDAASHIDGPRRIAHTPSSMRTVRRASHSIRCGCRPFGFSPTVGRRSGSSRPGKTPTRFRSRSSRGSILTNPYSTNRVLRYLLDDRVAKRSVTKPTLIELRWWPR